MAQVLYGGGVTAVRGKIGGLIFSANGTGEFVRAWARPVAVATADQYVSRARLPACSAAWAALDGTTQGYWNAFAASPPETDYDPWGNQRYLSGFQWFCRINLRRLAVGLDVDDGVPTPTSVSAPAWDTCYWKTPATAWNSVILNWVSNPFYPDDYAICHFAVGRGPGVAALTTGWREVYAANPGSGGQYHVYPPAAVYAAFGAVPVGMRFQARLCRQRADGVRSTWVTYTGLTTAGP